MPVGMKWYGDKIEKIVAETAFKAAHDGAEAILTASQNEVPLDTGTLWRSGTVTDVPSEGTVYVSYSTPYARRQHEDMTLNHPRGGKAKYLEDPFKRLTANITRLAAARIKAVLTKR